MLRSLMNVRMPDNIDEESYWGYWAKQALFGGINLDVTPLHRLLLESLSDKKIFVLSTNADAQFVKAGLPCEKIFCTQGDYFHIQCGKGCHDKTYDAVVVRDHDNISLIRLNLDQAVIPESFGERAVGINADMAESIKDIVKEVKRK